MSVGLTILLYGGALALPLYSDDLLLVPWVKATPFPDFWRALGPYGDYRPLHFTLWRIFFLLTGDLSPRLLYGLNLAGHALCGMLLGLLVSRTGPPAAALLAVLFFLVFPFGFSTVLWPAAFSYPLTAALSLGAVLLYLDARQHSSLWPHLLALVLTMLAGFAYEGGVIAGLSILWAEATLAEGRRSRWAALYLLASALPLLIILRLSPNPGGVLVVPQNAYDLAVALQAFAFPLAPLATLVQRIGWEPALAMVGMGIVTLFALGRWARRAGHLRCFGFGLGWAVLWAFIPLATQHNDWLRDPLRVLYPSAVGVALMWGVGLVGVPPRRLRPWAFLVYLALAVAALAPSAFFIRGRMALHRWVGDLIWGVVSEASRGPGSTLFVNLPSRMAPQGRFYPLGYEGVIPLPPPTNADVLARAYTGREGQALGRAMGAILPATPYRVELAGAPLTADDLRSARRVFVIAYRSDWLGSEEAGRVFPPQEPGLPVARYGQGIALLSVSCRREGEHRVHLSLRWQALGPVEGGPTVFAHLLEPGGQVVAQADGHPLRGLFPFSQWRPGEVVEEVRTFEGAPAGPATVALGVWEPAAGVRWEARGARGEVLPDYAFRCEVEAR